MTCFISFVRGLTSSFMIIILTPLILFVACVRERTVPTDITFYMDSQVSIRGNVSASGYDDAKDVIFEYSNISDLEMSGYHYSLQNIDGSSNEDGPCIEITKDISWEGKINDPYYLYTVCIWSNSTYFLTNEMHYSPLYNHSSLYIHDEIGTN